MPEPLGFELCVPELEALGWLLLAEDCDEESLAVSVLAQAARNAGSARPASTILVTLLI
jgi:hypothetical protein